MYRNKSSPEKINYGISQVVNDTGEIYCTYYGAQRPEGSTHGVIAKVLYCSPYGDKFELQSNC